MDKNELLTIVSDRLKKGELIFSATRKYTYEGIGNYTGTYEKLRNEEVLKLNTHTKNIKVANLFPEILAFLVEGLERGEIINSGVKFNEYIADIAWDSHGSLFPYLHTYESYYITMANKIIEVKGDYYYLEKEIEKSGKMSSKERKKASSRFGKIPIKVLREPQWIFKRNPHVVVDVLDRAGGICEYCKKQAPFKRDKDGTPYLEVHHKVKLADKGEDTIENAIALCPNCHRMHHFGVEGL